MSEENTQVAPEEVAVAAPVENQEVKLNGIYAFKQGMSSVYNEKGEMIPVTVLKFEPMVVSQLKSTEKEGYTAVQMAFKPKRSNRTAAAEAGHLKKAGFENGAYFVREVRQDLPEGVEVGQKISINSVNKGDLVQVTGKSKGHGFAGVMKRWGFGGGPASHGSGFHRRPGSIGNCEFPGRVMPGRKMAGHYGVETVTVKNVQVVDVLPEENVVLVKGPVPGSKNSLVKLMRV